MSRTVLRLITTTSMTQRGSIAAPPYPNHHLKCFSPTFWRTRQTFNHAGKSRNEAKLPAQKRIRADARQASNRPHVTSVVWRLTRVISWVSHKHWSLHLLLSLQNPIQNANKAYWPEPECSLHTQNGELRTLDSPGQLPTAVVPSLCVLISLSSLKAEAKPSGLSMVQDA